MDSLVDLSNFEKGKTPPRNMVAGAPPRRNRGAAIKTAFFILAGAAIIIIAGLAIDSVASRPDPNSPRFMENVPGQSEGGI